jgi:hypothetical protein
MKRKKGSENKSGQRLLPLYPVDETVVIKAKKGRPQVHIVRKKFFETENGPLKRLELSLIVKNAFPADNDRILGYDCSHESEYGPVHRHDHGKITSCNLSLEDVLEKFTGEVQTYLNDNHYPFNLRSL